MKIQEEKGNQELTRDILNRELVSPVTKEILEKYELRLRKLFADGDRLENLIVFSANSDVDTSKIRRQLLNVTTKIKELENQVGLEKVADLREQAKKLIDVK